MSVSGCEKALDPADRPSGGTVHSASRLPNNETGAVATWDGRALAEAAAKDITNDCHSNDAHKRVISGHRGKGNGTQDGCSVSSSTSSRSSGGGSLGDNGGGGPFGTSSRRHSNEPSLTSLCSLDINLPLEVINPIVDLIEDDADESFGGPLSQQDEKLLEELLR